MSSVASSSLERSDDSGILRATRVRYLVLAALACLTVDAYVTRVSLAPAASTIQGELSLSDVDMGYILGAFAFGYTWLQLPGGWLGGKLGARWSLTLFCAVWSLSTVATALSSTIPALWWSRFLCGLAQAGLFPVAIAAVAVWFPPTSRGRASAVITAFMSVGAVIASGLTVLLLGPLGWRGALQAYGWVGVAGAVVFLLWYRDTPEEHPSTNEAERRLIRGGIPTAAEAKQDAPISDLRAFGRMLGAASMWALCVQAFFRAFGYFFFVTWFPSFLERSYKVSSTLAGALNMLPLAGVVAGSFAGGYAVDLILKRTRNRWLSRSGVASASLTMCALATLAAVLTDGPIPAVALITVGTFFSGLAGPATWAATIDISGRNTAIGFALMNMSGNLGAIACPIVVAYLIAWIERTGSGWEPVLYLFAGIYFAGALAWLALDPNRSAVLPRTPAPLED